MHNVKLILFNGDNRDILALIVRYLFEWEFGHDKRNFNIRQKRAELHCVHDVEVFVRLWSRNNGPVIKIGENIDEAHEGETD